MSAAHHTGALLDAEITGTLTHDAELRTRPIDSEGLVVPVICMELATNGPAHMPVRVEWPQPKGAHQAAAALAKSLKRGHTVTVRAPWLGMRLVATNAAQVHASAPGPAPTTNPAPELF